MDRKTFASPLAGWEAVRTGDALYLVRSSDPGSGTPGTADYVEGASGIFAVVALRSTEPLIPLVHELLRQRTGLDVETVGKTRPGFEIREAEWTDGFAHVRSWFARHASGVGFELQYSRLPGEATQFAGSAIEAAFEQVLEKLGEAQPSIV